MRRNFLPTLIAIAIWPYESPEADQNDLGSAQDEIASPSASQMRRSPTEPRILLVPLEMEFFKCAGKTGKE